MKNHAYVILASLDPGGLELYVAVAKTEDEAREIIASRQGARTGESVMVAATLRNETAPKIGADLSKWGTYARFLPLG